MEKDNERGAAILAEAYSHYAALAPFRAERERNKRYHYGDQWGDIIEVDGERITEETYIKRQGSVPLKNNLIRRLVRNVVGVYSAQSTEPVCSARDQAEKPYAELMTRLLHCNMEVNRLRHLYSRTMEEFLIGGLIVHRKSFGLRGNVADCRTDFVQPGNFFIDSHMRDFRLWDCSCLGEIHDVPFSALATQFARSEADLKHLRDIFMPLPPSGLCRVVEVWRKECRRVQSPRWGLSEVWRYYFLAPSGEILAEGDTPYAHGEHPYVVKAYPMIDGEIHSFVNDVIDQQRHTNRLITLYDWVMRSSAKGVLLVPEDCVPPGTSYSDFANAWSHFNGTIFYRPSMQGDSPRQVSSNSTNIGIRELLDVQLRFFEDISGVSGSLQGKTSNVAISAELYGQQTQNATTTLLDLLDTFSEFVRDAAYKDIKNIQQFYTAHRVRSIVGDLAAGVCNNTGGIRDVDLDLHISPCLNTPAHRQQVNAQLMEIWKSGQISLEQMLAAGHFDFTL